MLIYGWPTVSQDIKLADTVTVAMMIYGWPTVSQDIKSANTVIVAMMSYGWPTVSQDKMSFCSSRWIPWTQDITA